MSDERTSEPQAFNPSLPAQQSIIVHAVGECLMAWAMAEEAIHELFVQQLVAHSTSPNRYTVARSVWFSVIGFDGRLRIADAAIKANYKDVELLADWRLLLRYTAKMSALRNEAAHGMLANFDNQEMKVMPYGTDILKDREPLTIAELKRRTRLFFELNDTLSWFLWCTSNQLKPNPRHHIHRTPELIAKLRKQTIKTRKAQERSVKS